MFCFLEGNNGWGRLEPQEECYASFNWEVPSASLSSAVLIDSRHEELTLPAFLIP